MKSMKTRTQTKEHMKLKEDRRRVNESDVKVSLADVHRVLYGETGKGGLKIHYDLNRLQPHLLSLKPRRLKLVLSYVAAAQRFADFPSVYTWGQLIDACQKSRPAAWPRP